MLHLDFRGPSFICLGVQKAGTTWLYKQFCSHPQFAMPKTKELRFFKPFNPSHSLEDYLKFFSKKGISGDMTPEYFIGKNNPKTIKIMFPKVKLFVILRNPTERAFSHYRMMRNYKVTEKNFIDVFQSNIRDLAFKGLYDIHLNNYLEYFTLNKNIKVMFYDDLVSEPIRFYSELCQYLNADLIFDESIYQKLESRYKNDGLAISSDDKKRVDQFYEKSISNISKILGKELSWMSKKGVEIETSGSL